MGDYHDNFVKWFSVNRTGLISNLRPPTKYPINEGERQFIPDLVTEDSVVEVEVTSDKSHYFKINKYKKRLIVLVNSFEAFDAVELYSVKNGEDPKFIMEVK